MVTLTAINSEFEIPPYAENHAVSASVGWLPERGRLLAITPHMHLRGKSFRVFANRSLGSEDAQTLLSVPSYDFNWQHVYSLADPLPLSSISKLWIEARFDNSDGNSANPDPGSTVYWGDQTDEEMAIGFFEVALPRHDATDFRNRKTNPKVRQNRSTSPENIQRAKRFAREYVSRWDVDDNGTLSREELPQSVAHFGMGQLDRNRNGTIELGEIEQLHLERIESQPN